MARIPFSIALVATILLGFLLRLPLLSKFPFREDEAIYSFWAIQVWQDPLFLSVWPDKPPLYLWSLFLVFNFLGISELSVRWFNVVLSVLTIPVTAIIARHQWGPLAGVLTGMTLALNPFAIAFSATGYTGPLLVLAGMLALLAAFYGASFWAGIWLGAAIMTKQQGLFYVPLIVAILSVLRLPSRKVSTLHPTEILSKQKSSELTRHADLSSANLQDKHPVSQQTSSVHRPHLTGFADTTGIQLFLRTNKYYTNFFAGLALILLLVIYWDSLRWHVAPSPWDLSIRNYGPLHLSPPNQWFHRLQEWSSLLWYLTSNHFIWGCMGIVLCGLFVGRSIRKTRMFVSRMPFGFRRPTHQLTLFMDRNAEQNFFPIKPSTAIPLCLGVWILGFLLIHILTTIQLWDRYLLPLAPIIALLCGWLFRQVDGMINLSEKITYSLKGLFIAFWVLLLWPSAVNAANGRLPIGGDHGAYAGFWEALTEIQKRLPGEQPAEKSGKESNKRLIVYHRVLGWHYQFYLYSQMKSDLIELRWYPNSVSLVDNARKAAHRSRFLLQPSWSPIRDLAFHANLQKIELVRHGKFGNFHLFELRNKPPSDCSWCICRQPFYRFDQSKEPF